MTRKKQVFLFCVMQCTVFVINDGDAFYNFSHIRYKSEVQFQSWNLERCDVVTIQAVSEAT